MKREREQVCGSGSTVALPSHTISMGYYIRSDKVSLSHTEIQGDTWLAAEIPCPCRWSSHGKAYPLRSARAAPCHFPKCGQLDCTIRGSGGLCSCSPLININKYKGIRISKAIKKKTRGIWCSNYTAASCTQLPRDPTTGMLMHILYSNILMCASYTHKSTSKRMTLHSRMPRCTPNHSHMCLTHMRAIAWQMCIPTCTNYTQMPVLLPVEAHTHTFSYPSLRLLFPSHTGLLSWANKVYSLKGMAYVSLFKCVLQDQKIK